MCHWQWFLLVIAVFFVVSNGGERINRRRSIHVDSHSKKKRETSEPEEMSTNVKFPLWVTIGGMGSIGATTEYKEINDKLYEFTLPFLVLVKESDVCTNRSATQDENLAYPFWVRITEISGEYVNESAEGKVRLAFPFDLEVARMSLIGICHGEKLATRALGDVVLVGTVALFGATYAAVYVLGTLTGAILVAHVVRASINTLIEAAVEIFRPHDHAYGELARPKTIIGSIMGSVAGVIVSFVPGLGHVIQAGILHVASTFGDSLVTFVNELLKFHVIGDAVRGINIIINIFCVLGFVSRSKLPKSVPGVLLPPPTIIVPTLPAPPPTDVNKIVVQIYYGQTTIPGFPGYVIVWPGKEEPPVTDLVIVRPIVPTLPNRPNIRLVWPLQSTSNVRPNIILIRPGQRFIPGYVNVIIAWPSDPLPPPIDQDKTIIRPNDTVIPNIIGVVLMWPGQVPDEGPYVINLLPGQRQSPDFPTIIFSYPGDPAPPPYPGITVASPPEMDLPGYPGIKIIWPPKFRPPSQVDPPRGPVMIGPDDFQVPGFPNVLIKHPGQSPSRSNPGIIYVEPGQATIPGYSNLTLRWPVEKQKMELFPYVTVYIPPEFNFVPGFPDYPITRPGAPRSNSPRLVKQGDKTLPDNPNVFLMWLDRPTDLVLEPSPDIMQAEYLYDGTVSLPYKRKRNVEQSEGRDSTYLNEIEMPEGEFMRIWKTDVTKLKYGGHYNTFDVEHLNVSIGGYVKAKFAHEKTLNQNPWNFNIKKSQLRQRTKQLLGLSSRG